MAVRAQFLSNDSYEIKCAKWFTFQTSYCNYARPVQPGPIRWLGPLRSDSVIKLVTVFSGKCTTLVGTKCWLMETRLPWGDQWKAEKLLGAFWRWPITKCFIKSDRAGLILVTPYIFALTANIDGPWNDEAFFVPGLANAVTFVFFLFVF